MRRASVARAKRMLVIAVTVAATFGGGGCKKKVTQDQCDQILDHFAELVVRERYPDAGADTIAAERTRERHEATHANEFKNCTSAVQAGEHDCAMKAQSSDALIHCLD